MENRIGATLRLQNGMEFRGWSFGYDKPCDGEVVFSTAMVGYPESLTDSAYSGQILCVTYPLIGNYGVPDEGLTVEGISKNFESEKIWVRGLVISDYSYHYSHWDAVKSLDAWLKEQKIPGIFGIDTRELTKVLRENGTMLGIIIPDGGVKEFPVPDPNTINQVAIVSCKEPVTYGKGDKHVVVVDCGVQHNVMRTLVNKGIQVTRVPWDYDFNTMEYDGLLISSGPGNPESCKATIAHLKEAIKGDKPILGIGMGCELLALATGASTYKLKYGHRSHNQPVRKVGENRCIITAQNHGYSVDDSSLATGWEPWFINMNDGTNEGIKHTTKPFCGVQFYPDAEIGETETSFLIEDFISKL